MSRKTDKERAARGEIFRNGHKIRIAPGETLDHNMPRGMTYFCSKCRHVISEDMIAGHLALCQPEGTICGYCGKKFLAHEIVDHMKNCRKKTVLKLTPGAVKT